ncbi:MAG: MarR family transcriptional regulator [Acidimicrobiia bacterium]|nr:MarR family transcriptional regulator [Acidimicrobiia bacterium]
MQPSAETLSAWRLLLETHRRLATALDRELVDEHDLALDWYDVLIQLNEAGGRLRMHELSEATLFSRTGCTRLVDRMARAGLVRRERATDDGRGVVAVLTPAGKSRLRAAAGTHLAGIQRLFGEHLETLEVAALRTGLGRVVEAATNRSHTEHSHRSTA